MHCNRSGPVGVVLVRGGGPWRKSLLVGFVAVLSFESELHGYSAASGFRGWWRAFLRIVRALRIRAHWPFIFGCETHCEALRIAIRLGQLTRVPV